MTMAVEVTCMLIVVIAMMVHATLTPTLHATVMDMVTHVVELTITMIADYIMEIMDIHQVHHVEMDSTCT